MIKDTDMIEVQNKINATVAYEVPDLNNLVREFRPNEIKKVTMDELRRLSYINGGKTILEQYLFIRNNEAVQELVGEVEPEYFYTTDDLKNLLENGTLDEFDDFLNFAPTGMKETIKDMAVDMQLNDNHKRDMIKKYLGFDVTKAIELLKDEETGELEQPVVPKKKARKTAPISHEDKEKTSNKTTRKYKIVD